MSGCTAAMDVLTSAASAHEAASETHSSGETSQISSEAQILALKRKLIECDQESRDQRERIAGLEKALEIEKRVLNFWRSCTCAGGMQRPQA